MGTIVAQVIEALKSAQIRADEAYPGGRIPALSGPVAAVRLGKVDRAIRTTVVQVVIMSPAAGGGAACEKVALKALDILEEMGGSCVKDVCRFDEMADVFYIDMDCEFFGTALEEDWSSGPGYAVTIGEQPLEYVTSFSSGRKVGEEGASISDAQWQFTLKELLPPGTSEPPDPEEPFAVTVTRKNVDELFAGCTWDSVSREETIRGIVQVRSGTAESRSTMGIL